MSLNSNRGWHWNPESRNLTFYFELDGAAEDSDGNPTKAGAKIEMADCKAEPDEERYDQFVRNIEREGLHGFPATGITRDEFEARYDND